MDEQGRAGALQLGRGILFASGTRVYGIGVGLATLLVTTRWMGPEARGVFVSLTTWSALFATFGALSLGQVAIHVGTTRRREDWMPSVLGSLVVLAGAISIACWVAGGVLLFVRGPVAFGTRDVLAIAAAAALVPLLMWEQYGSNLLMAVGRLDTYNQAQVVGRTLGLAVLALTLWAGWSVLGAMASVIAGQAIVASGGSHRLWRTAGRRLAPDWKTARTLVSGGLKLHAGTIGVFLSSSVSILILTAMRGPAEAGFYQLAFQLVQTMLLLPQAAAMVFYGRIAQDGPAASWEVCRPVVLVVTLLMGAASATAWVLAPWVLPLVVGAGFEPVVPLFRGMMWTVAGFSISAMMSPHWIGRGLFLAASALSIGAGLVNSLLAWVLVPTVGLAGALWALQVTVAFSTAANLVLVVANERSRSASR